MTRRLTVEEIRAYWTAQALRHGQSAAASWSDTHAMELEIRTLLDRLADDESVLDVGCANGFTTLRLAAERPLRIRGLDYVPRMIEEAKLHLEAIRDRLRGEVEFGVGDITALPEPTGLYDKVIVVRVLINLHDWERQIRALRECARVLKPGGQLLVSEATMQGWRKLNALRAEWHLDEIPMPSFNTYLDQEKVIEAAADVLECREVVDFASTYYVGTRVIKPLLMKALGDPPADAANPEMEWNRWVSLLPAAGDYGTQKLFVFKKR
ncbi:MAG: class I SAM-dependent methyltransferase [Candidatus Riflebacteria bacterium]|nr:class I SAM-dependent methyltransferase [Candidatus Riflebacteria bacterium]